MRKAAGILMIIGGLLGGSIYLSLGADALVRIFGWDIIQTPTFRYHLLIGLILMVLIVLGGVMASKAIAWKFTSAMSICSILLFPLLGIPALILLIMRKGEFLSRQEFIEINAGQLYQEYKSNEIAADLKYEDKLLKVHGIVKSIGEDIMGDPYVVIVGNEGDLLGIQCIYPNTDAYRELLAKVNPGQEMTVTRKCKGYLIGNVLLEHE